LLLCLLALEDGLHGVAGFGYAGERERGLGFLLGPSRWRWTASALEVRAHLLRLIFFDGAGVRLFLGDAYRCQSIKDGSALFFEFSCKIVNSNFAHLSLLSAGG
jgi:hypothetical protein